MGKGHKDRRREQRARELEQVSTEERLLKEEAQREADEKNEAHQKLKQQQHQQNDEQVQPEKLVETSSDTDSGHGSSTTTSSDSPKQTQTEESVEQKKRQTLVKGLVNIGNTCFFNVVIQSLAHTPLLIDKIYQTKCHSIEENGTSYFSTTTSQLVKIFDEFTSNDRKKTSINPKPLFNSLIQKNPAYKGYDQHDSHELFMNLMLILRAEEVQLKKLRNRSTRHSDDENDPSKMFCLIGCNEPYTDYDSIFGGHLLDTLTCKTCGKSLMKIEPFLGILLPLTDRTSPAENYRQRRKRDDYTGNKAKKEPKILSRKQQKALKKQEKRNSRKGVAATTSRLKGRQSAKKKPVEEQLSVEESASLPPTEASQPTEEETPAGEPSVSTELVTAETSEAQTDTPAQEDDEETSVVDNNEDEPVADEESDNDDEPEGPLTAVESTCMLSDMVSKLTLIHETSCRPLPFVDECLAQQFLACNPSANKTGDETTEDIKTLEQCFQRYFKSETLSGENSFDCYYCRSQNPGQKKVLTEATRQTVFFQLPPILPVFLKRFQMHGSHSEKIQKFIQFPLELNLAHRCSSQVKSESSRYALYAVVEHSGTLRSGHYIAYVKQSINEDFVPDELCSKPIDVLLANLFQTTTQNDESSNKQKTIDPSAPPASWYHISDETIHKVPESKVLEADAYVLFYRKIQENV